MLPSVLWVGLVVGVCGWSVWRGQRRWMSSSGPAVDLLAWSVLTLTVVTTMAQLLGAFGLLRGWGVVALTALVGVVGWSIGRRAPAELDVPDRRPGVVGASRRSVDVSTWPGRLEIGVMVASVAAVGAQWGAHLGDAYSRGMVQPDNLWYHGPFVARIAQTAGLGSLAPFGYAEARSFPLNTHVLGAMLTFPTGTDVLIPTLNHLFAALALLAAWVIGSRRGAGAPAVVAMVAVLSLPLVSSTQPGQMYNDVAALALVLAAVALFSVADDVVAQDPSSATTTTGVACGGVCSTGVASTHLGLVVTGFLALGWAMSTKLTVVAPLAVIAVGMVVVLLRRRDRIAALCGSIAFVVTGGVWFVRNLVVSGSPMPYADLTIGPFGFEQQVPRSGETLLSTLGDLDRQGRYYLDSLDVSFGPLWFVVVVGALAGSIVGVTVLRASLRVAAIGGLVGLAAFPLMPLTGGLPFVNNLRYAIVALALGAIVGAVVAGGRTWSRWGVLAGSVAVIVVNLASPHRARVPAWPHESWWAVAGAAVAAVLAAAPWWWGRWRSTETADRPHRWAFVGWGALATAVVVLAIALPGLDDRYLEGRYAGTDFPNAVLYAASAGDDVAHVDVFAVDETYPFFGPHLDRSVESWNDRLDEIPAGAAGCPVVRGWLSDPPAGEVGRIAVGRAWLMRSISPDERAAWFEADPAVDVVFDDGEQAMYERVDALDPSACGT